MTRSRRAFVNFGTLLLLAVGGGCAVLVGQRFVERARAQSVADREFTRAVVRDLRGRRVPLVPAGVPTVVMLNSRTCPWCRKALADFGSMAAGRTVPRFTVLTIEGAAAGVPMLEKEQLRGARLVGPAGSSEQALALFRYPGTPIFVAVDVEGRVVHTIPGYPIRPELERLFSVMVGESDVP